MTGNDLINTATPAPFQLETALAAWQSFDYYHMRPYPIHAFGTSQWPREKGPPPTPLPYVGMMVSELAEFTFRNGVPTFSVPDDPDLDDFLQTIIKRNGLPSQYIPLAEDAGNQGALAAKFMVDPNDKACPVKISFLKIPTECRVWIDPHDRLNLLMARIQYPYRSLADGNWYYYREEWTDEKFVKYVPLPAGASDVTGIGSLPGYRTHLGDTDDPGRWQIESEEENPLGVIPITVIRNKAVAGNPLGEGDCWRVFRLIDRIALTLHGEDRGNQMHSEPNLVVTNADVDNEGPLLPGEPLSIRNDNPDVRADAKLLEPSGAARAYSGAYADRMEDLLYRGVGLSRVDPAAITNKGNMTSLAFAMTFSRTIATADRKRELWGASGLCLFFHQVLTALQNMGGFPQVRTWDPEMEVSCDWPTYFAETPRDLQATTDRTISQVNNHLLPHARGVERVARAEKIPPNEIKTVQVEAETQRQETEAKIIAMQNQGMTPTAADAAGEASSLLVDASQGSNISA